MPVNHPGEPVEGPTPPDLVDASFEQPSEETSFDDVLGQAAARMSGEPVPSKEPEADPEQDEPEGDGEPEPEADPEPKPTPTKKVKVGGQEVELTEEQLVALASQGLDYTRKTQALSAQRKQLEGFNALIGKLQEDPEFARHVFDYGRKADRPQASAETVTDTSTPPEDPIERLKWEAVQQAKREIASELMPQIKPLFEKQQAISHQQVVERTLNQVRQDPLFQGVAQEIHDYLLAQPEEIRGMVAGRIDRDPQAFMDVYMNRRQALVGKIEAAEKAKRSEAAKKAAQTKKENASAPPKLESAGPAKQQVTSQATDGSKEFKSLTQKIQANRGSIDDIGRYLELSGAIGKINAKRK